MPVTAREILDAADELAGGKREVDWRNGASRAYYAAFHRCRQLAVAERLAVAQTGSAHVALIDAFLANLNPAPLKRLGFMLRGCRDRRADADYEVEASFSKQVGRSVVADCQRILDEADAV